MLEVMEKLPKEASNRREVAYGLAMAQNSLKRDKKLSWDFEPESVYES